MSRLVFVVGRHLPAVYEHLCRQFAGEPDVEVFVDRRVAQRRHGGHGMPPSRERRQRDRRRNAKADEELRTMGYAFVRVD
ncbi:MAG TPA: hypothetical protein VFJ24_04780 [Gaiellales bacterium]|nr:hypothetical protein [Gaiellales bacterium]